MLRLQISKEDIGYICEKYSIDDGNFVETVYDEVSSFYVNVKKQHLSAIMRCLEFKARKVFGEEFRIDWGEMAIDSTISNGMFFPKEKRYTISLPKGTSDERARYIVAHELGHLYYLLKYTEALEKPRNEMPLVEFANFKEKFLREDQNALHKKANIFGAFLILERAEFYNIKVPEMQKSYLNKTKVQVIDEFDFPQRKINSTEVTVAML
ncbi:MAG: ImmA/IrrE family metallo-endopeptidase [Fibromonadaceae bacterium]|jgi:Zn-dependent peptidase ImmA (M78 family)|nr:ImmA/IrrE family metallo-endopeptidase [Fibromonadaceae bacterium]